MQIKNLDLLFSISTILIKWLLWLENNYVKLNEQLSSFSVIEFQIQRFWMKFISSISKINLFFFGRLTLDKLIRKILIF